MDAEPHARARLAVKMNAVLDLTFVGTNVRSRTAFIFTASLALACGSASIVAHAQVLTYSKGQPISAAYEGWEVDPDGSKYFIFGYENKNWEEEIDVPVGPDNGFQPGPADRGQPTHFYPRRNRYV